MKKLFYFTYALVCYVIFLVTFLYLIGFTENIQWYFPSLAPWFPKSLDAGASALSAPMAILTNLGLIALFGIQHSVMARPAFKEKWTKAIPRPIERSTYVLLASLALILLFYCWQPITQNIWSLSDTTAGAVLLTLSFAGWAMLLVSTFLISHFDLFGLQQVYRYAGGREPEQLSFRTPGFYRIIRHPIYFSFLLAFWSAPVMTVAHLVFNLGMTAYVFTGIYHEEKDLVKSYGDTYIRYQEETAMIIPLHVKRRQPGGNVSAAEKSPREARFEDG